MIMLKLYLCLALVFTGCLLYWVLLPDRIIKSDVKWLDERFGPFRDNRDIALQAHREAVHLFAVMAAFFYLMAWAAGS